MVTKNYNISVEGKEFIYTYSNFIAKYGTSLKRIGGNNQTYDINNTAVILNLIDEKEIKLKQANNLTLIGTEKLVNKTIKEIKNKKFLLEEIIK